MIDWCILIFFPLLFQADKRCPVLTDLREKSHPRILIINFKQIPEIFLVPGEKCSPILFDRKFSTLNLSLLGELCAHWKGL